MISINTRKIRGTGAGRSLAALAIASLCACPAFAGSIVDLGDLGGDSTIAYAMSSNGNVVGVSLPSSGNAYHTFIYSGGSMSDSGFNS